MLRLTSRAWVDYRRVAAATKRGERRALTRAAAAIRLTAARSIRQSRNASVPGSPPHTRQGRLRRAILYALLEEDGFQAAFIGPSVDLFGTAGKAHEFGGYFRGELYPERPFMQPALSLIGNRLPAFFSGQAT